MSRLMAESPGLAAQIASAPGDHAQRFARLACEAAGVDDPVPLALTDSVTGAVASSADTARVGELETDVDGDYFVLLNAERRLSEPEEESRQRNFARARAMSAVLKSLDADPKTAARPPLVSPDGESGVVHAHVPFDLTHCRGMTSETQTVEQQPDHYDGFADAYARANENGLFNRWYARPAVMNLLGDVAGHRILDAGCGSGPLLADLRAQGASVAGSTRAPR